MLRSGGGIITAILVFLLSPYGVDSWGKPPLSYVTSSNESRKPIMITFYSGIAPFRCWSCSGNCNMTLEFYRTHELLLCSLHGKEDRCYTAIYYNAGGKADWGNTKRARKSCVHPGSEIATVKSGECAPRRIQVEYGRVFAMVCVCGTNMCNSVSIPSVPPAVFVITLNIILRTR